MEIQVCQYYLLKRLSLLHCRFLRLLSNQGGCRCMGLCLGSLFCFAGVSLCLYQYHAIFTTIGVQGPSVFVLLSLVIKETALA